MLLRFLRHVLIAGAAIAVAMGLTVLLGLGVRMQAANAADPDVYMAELEVYLEGDDRQEEAERIVGEIDTVLEGDEIDEGAQELFRQSLDGGESAIEEHAMAHGWTVTLMFLRDLLLVVGR